MKKNLLYIAAIATALVGCSSNDIVEEIQEQELPMAFETMTDNATRAITNEGSETTNLESYHTTFGVWTFKSTSTTAVMDNYKAEYASTGTEWVYEGKTGKKDVTQYLKYWDKLATYSFYAYAPYSSDNASLTTDKIAIKEGQYAANENLQTELSKTCNSSAFGGTGAEATNKSTDWMIATPISKYATYTGKVGLVFNHTLAKVIVKVKRTAGFDKKITISTISLSNVHGTGSYNGTTWTASDDAKTITGQKGALTTDDVYYSMEYLLMPSADAPSFTIEYTIGDDPEIYKFDNVAITNVTSVVGNYSYIITATVGPNPIEFDATVAPYTQATDDTLNY